MIRQYETLKHIKTKKGVTLAELMIASVLAVMVLVAVGSVDVARFRITQDIYRHSSILAPDHWETALATAHLEKVALDADRIVIVNGGSGLQIRRPMCVGEPTGACLDTAAGYRWDQYQLNGLTNLRFYEDIVNNGCGQFQTLARQLEIANGFLVQVIDETPSPPGGFPVNDNNIFLYSMIWDTGPGPQQLTHEFTGELVLRSSGYTNTPVGLDWTGGDISPPPLVCL